jgi:excisionase family DNA binding protein
VQGIVIVDSPKPSTEPDPTFLRLLTIDQVADLLQASARTVRRHIDSGELAVVRIGRLVRIRTEAIEAFLGKMTKGNKNIK